MFNRPGAAGNMDDAAWAYPAIYALECGLTALWSSVGIQPSVVVGHDLGEIAAAQAAGVFGLEDGLRLAAARGAAAAVSADAEQRQPVADELEAALTGAIIASPSLTVVSSVTGRAVASGETLDAAYWRRQAQEPEVFDKCVETLADLGVEVIVQIGSHSILGPKTDKVRPKKTAGKGTNRNAAESPLVLSNLQKPSGDGLPIDGGDGFVEAVAAAYEAGLPVAFAGLFAGETRRRISLPGYPFQRLRYWIDTSK